MVLMATIVFFHAHPDDEASATAGTMARATAEGHRVVVVYATNGDYGDVPQDLAVDESLVDRRRSEAECSAQVLGVARVAWLGYADSGMTGWTQNGQETNFHRADLDEAGAALSSILDEEDADDLVGYDWHGNYGHPDHVKVHPVTYRAAALARRRPRVMEVTLNRDLVREGINRAREINLDVEMDVDAGDDGNPLGTPAAEIHWQVDVSDYLDRKRQAMQCHASQTSDIGMFLAMPPELFAASFSREHYREHGRPNGMITGWPF